MTHDDEAAVQPAVGTPVERHVRRLLAVLRWPARRGSNLSPWYVIAWRLLWAPAIYGGWALSFCGIAMANGWRAACDWLRDAA
jgi:hypothetical protein